MDDRWSSTDLPVLIATARILEEKDPVDSSDVVEVTGLTHREVVIALTNLGQRHLIVEDSSAFEGRDVYVTGIRAAGLEASGQWPTPDAAADRLVDAFNQLIDAEPDESPKRSRLVAVRDELIAVGRDVLVDVAGAVISGRLPV